MNKRRSFYSRNKFMINLIAAVVGGFALVAGSIVYYMVQKEAEWEKFAAAHKCVVVAKTAGRAGYGMTLDGKMGTVYMLSSTTYRCDDGIEYTR